MAERLSFLAGPADEGRRLDLFIVERMPGVSRRTVQRWVSAGGVRVGDQPRKASCRLHAGDSVFVTPEDAPPADLLPEELPLDILFEDSELAVVNKPAGMVVHPGAGVRSGTLANALHFHFSQISRAETSRPGIVHRLDKQTSGVIVVARTEAAHDFLARQFKERTVSKQYLALVYGRLAKQSGSIQVPIGRDRTMRTRISARSRKPREAVTEFCVISNYSGFTYLRAFPRTGRTHQIRVHFELIGHPVVGDETYGRNALARIASPALRAAIKGLGRHFLHAERLEFTHPATGQPVSFEAPLPSELARFLDTLGEC